MASGKGVAGVDLPLDQALPRELMVLIVADHMHDKSDVKRLSLTSRSFFRLVRSPELVAAWLWKRHGNFAMVMAMHNDDMAVLRQLVEVQHADVNVLFDDRWGLLQLACSDGKLEFVAYLLSVPGIQVNLCPSWTAFHVACSNGHLAIIQTLLQHPAIDVNFKENPESHSALYLACEKDKLEVVKELLAHPRININQTGGPLSWTGLHVACLRGHSKVVRVLLKSPDVQVNLKQGSRNEDGDYGLNALQCCLFGDAKGKARRATLKALLKHPGLNRGDMRAALQMAQSHTRLNRCAQAIADAL